MRTDSSSFIGGDYLYDVLSDREVPPEKLIHTVFNNSYDDKRYVINDDITIALIDYK